MRSLISALAILTIAVSAHADSSGVTPEQRSLLTRLIQRDIGPSVQRVKILSSDAETADPSIPMVMTMPNGNQEWRVYFTEHKYIAARSIEDLLRGGYFPLQFIQAFYADGTEIPWNSGVQGTDGEPLFLASADTSGNVSAKSLALLGLLEQPSPGKIPAPLTVPTRSTHVMDRTLKEVAPNVYREIWMDRGSVNDDKSENNQWLNIKADGTLAHGYVCGTRIVRVNGMPWRDAQGHAWLIYDRVDQQMNNYPVRNEVFARAFDETLKRATGPEISLLKVNPWNSVIPFPSASKGAMAGYSVEGANLVFMRVSGRSYWVMTFSAGSPFSQNYGTHLAYRPANLGPIGPYQPLMDARGDLVDLTADITAKYGFTWGIGRTSLFADPQGRIWGVAHGLAKAQLASSNVPRVVMTLPGQVSPYKRSLILVPFEAKLLNNQPTLKVLDNP